jgi:hypothetical protein
MEIGGLSYSCFGGAEPTLSLSGLRSRGTCGGGFRRRRQRRNAASMAKTMTRIIPIAIPALHRWGVLY